MRPYNIKINYPQSLPKDSLPVNKAKPYSVPKDYLAHEDPSGIMISGDDFRKEKISDPLSVEITREYMFDLVARSGAIYALKTPLTILLSMTVAKQVDNGYLKALNNYLSTSDAYKRTYTNNLFLLRVKAFALPATMIDMICELADLSTVTNITLNTFFSTILMVEHPTRFHMIHSRKHDFVYKTGKSHAVDLTTIKSYEEFRALATNGLNIRTNQAGFAASIVEGLNVSIPILEQKWMKDKQYREAFVEAFKVGTKAMLRNLNLRNIDPEKYQERGHSTRDFTRKFTKEDWEALENKVSIFKKNLHAQICFIALRNLFTTMYLLNDKLVDSIIEHHKLDDEHRPLINRSIFISSFFGSAFSDHTVTSLSRGEKEAKHVLKDTWHDICTGQIRKIISSATISRNLFFFLAGATITKAPGLARYLYNNLDVLIESAFTEMFLEREQVERICPQREATNQAQESELATHHCKFTDTIEHSPSYSRKL